MAALRAPPLGLALGRTVWRLVAETTPLRYRPPEVLMTVVVLVAAALAAAPLVAGLPGRYAVRLDAVRLLRPE